MSERMNETEQPAITAAPNDSAKVTPPTPPVRKKMNIWLIIGIAFLVLLVLCCAVVSIVTKGSIKKFNQFMADPTPTPSGAVQYSGSSIGNTQGVSIPKKSGGQLKRGNVVIDTYADINVDQAVNVPFWNDATSIPVKLNDKIEAYLITPNGYGRETAAILSPYTSMPTGKDHPLLSDELGYGLEVELENSNFNNFEKPMYLVFSLDGGKTINDIEKDKKLSRYCSPRQYTFDPMECALLKKVPAASHTNYQFGVVHPLFYDDGSQTLEINRTLPIGFDNLVVSQITSQGTYIPQKWSVETLTSAVKSTTLKRTTYEAVEPLMLRMNIGLLLDDHEVENFGSLFNVSMGYIDNFKTLQMKDAYKRFIQESMKVVNETSKSSLEQQSAFFDKDYDRIKADLATSVQGSATYKDGDAVTAAAFIKRLETTNVIDGKKLCHTLANRATNGLVYFLDKDKNEALPDNGYYTWMHGIAICLPEKFPAKTSWLPSLDSIHFIPVAHASDKDTEYSDDQMSKEVHDRAVASAEATLANPDASLTDLVEAAQAAYLVGEDELGDKCIDKAKQKLKDMLKDIANKSSWDILRGWQLGQAFGLDDDDPGFNDRMRDYFLKAKKHELCEKLSLKTFAHKLAGCVPGND